MIAKLYTKAVFMYKNISLAGTEALYLTKIFRRPGATKSWINIIKVAK